jgi:hypothetical protein
MSIQNNSQTFFGNRDRQAQKPTTCPFQTHSNQKQEAGFNDKTLALDWESTQDAYIN